MKQKPEFRLAKSLPGPSQIERVRAARAILNGRRGSEAMALYGFMAIFHPDYPTAKVTSMVNDVRDRERGR